MPTTEMSLPLSGADLKGLLTKVRSNVALNVIAPKKELAEYKADAALWPPTPI
jgi:hypothetical protein